MSRVQSALAALIARWEQLSTRERRLLGVAGAITALSLSTLTVGAVRDDLAMLRARVAGHERELADVRRLAARVHRQGTGAAADEPALMSRLEAAAADAVGRERIAAMAPAGPASPVDDDRMAVRVVGASLPEVVRLLHTLEAGTPPLAVARLDLRKHQDDPARFDATVEVGRAAGAP